MRFADPLWLVALVLVPLPLIWERARARVTWPGFEGFPPRSRRSLRSALSSLPAVLRGLALGAAVVALARPQTVGGSVRVAGRGVAIVVALDRSSSMRTPDFDADRGTRRISRLDAAKDTFARFVEGRPDDLIGLVVFANHPDLTCPPTLDHRFLLEAAAAVQVARPGDDGTNIGDAVAWSIDALRQTSPSRKVLVLLTDGHNQPAVVNPLDPETAAKLAGDLGVTLHTIALGRPGGIRHGTDPDSGRAAIAEAEGPNLPLLERMAALGGGRCFVAADRDTLRDVFSLIDQLERSPVSGRILTRYEERFTPWAALALILLALDRLLAAGPLCRLP